jgi:hypothetical protein
MPREERSLASPDWFGQYVRLEELTTFHHLDLMCGNVLLAQEMTHRAFVRCAISPAMSVMRCHLLRTVPIVIIRTPVMARGWGMVSPTTGFAPQRTADLVAMVVEAIDERDGQQVVNQQHECHASLPIHPQTSTPTPIGSDDRK